MGLRRGRCARRGRCEVRPRRPRPSRKGWIWTSILSRKGERAVCLRGGSTLDAIAPAALVLGVCICAAGVLLLVNPFEKNDTLLFAAALGFLLDGISGLFTTVAVAHGKSRAEFLAGQAPVIELDPAEAAETLPDGKTEPLPESEAVPADTGKAEAEAKTESPAEKE